MKCSKNSEVKILEYNGKYIVGARDEYGPFCKISPEFYSRDEAEEFLKNLHNSDRIICDVCNKNSLCR